MTKSIRFDCRLFKLGAPSSPSLVCVVPHSIVELYNLKNGDVCAFEYIKRLDFMPETLSLDGFSMKPLPSMIKFINKIEHTLPLFDDSVKKHFIKLISILKLPKKKHINTIAGAVLYICYAQLGKHQIQMVISNIVGCTEVSLRNAYSSILSLNNMQRIPNPHYKKNRGVTVESG